VRSIIPAVAHWLRRGAGPSRDLPGLPPGSRATRGRDGPLSSPERDDFSSNRHPALSFCLSMIFSENRFPLFRIMLQGRPLVSPGFPGCSGAGRSAPARPEPQHIHRPRSGNLRDPAAACCARIHRPPSIVPVIAKLPLIVPSKPASCNSPGRTYSHTAGARPQRSCRHIPCAICTPLLRASCHRRGPALQ
jgi:hypothetical protein